MSAPTASLKAAFKARTVDKIYHAVAQGHPDPSAGTIDAPIGRHPKADWKFAVIAGGRDSVTHYDTLEAFPAASLLEVHLETGRTHQIRVHMAAIRHSLVGDLAYGADPTLAERLKLTRQWLHAFSTGRWVQYEAPYRRTSGRAGDSARMRAASAARRRAALAAASLAVLVAGDRRLSRSRAEHRRRHRARDVSAVPDRKHADRHDELSLSPARARAGR